ncbi:uncharacterized protein LOC121740491 [Aricia agestis]|uniref:uncharacterized protein LOC121740491 n=1 Tax=Aricia agestis TaxID=91739 RepID=UPI001C204C0A|nr:uncharacterized protein LOC121740491 [Aricia agestis]
MENLFALVKMKIMHKEITIISAYNHTCLYILLRCFKCAFVVTMPCYCCSLVKKQVKTIRTLLHSGINAKNKNQRDELKAFYQLTKDNDFSHKLFSVVNLAMDFPLKYLNTCLTYIIIMIQFSKFID